MNLHGSGVGIIENGACRLWLKDGCVGAGGVNPSLVCFRSMYWLDASARAAHLDPSMDVEKPRHANTQQHVGGPFTRSLIFIHILIAFRLSRAAAGRAVSPARRAARLGWCAVLRNADHPMRVIVPLVYLPMVLMWLGSVSFGADWAAMYAISGCGDALAGNVHASGHANYFTR